MSATRKLLPGDAGALLRHLTRLDGESRRCRFGAFLGDGALANHVASINWFKSLHLGHWEDGELRAAASLNWTGGMLVPPAAAEVAVAVEPGWQGRGIGTKLVRRALLLARNRAMLRVGFLCSPENSRARSLFTKLGSRLRYRDGFMTGDLPLPVPTQLSMLEEWIDDGTAAMDAVMPRALEGDTLRRQA
jgi:GNAT superfamily N-acetyltransferase